MHQIIAKLESDNSRLFKEAVIAEEMSNNNSVFFEGINITNEIMRKHGLYDNHVLAIIENGSRYSIGVRAAF